MWRKYRVVGETCAVEEHAQEAQRALPLGSEVIRSVALAVGVGLLTGTFTQIGQSVLPDGFGQAANSISVWLAVAFGLGSVMPRPNLAAVAGVVALACALVGYYALVWIRFGWTGGSTALVMWSIGALLGGAVFGPAGWYWRHGDVRQRVIASALLGAAFAAEGIYLITILSSPSVGLAFVGVGVAVPLVLGRTGRERAYGLVGMVPALALGGAGFTAFLLLYRVVAGL